MSEPRDQDESPALQRLRAEGAVAQLRQGTGRMAELGSENGRLMLDWVEAVPRLLERPDLLEAVESEAREILDRGITDIIWSGMGGSVMAVRVLANLGIRSPDSRLRIHALDSTDPAAINAVLEAIVGRWRLDPDVPTDLSDLLGRVMMIAVSMGMTSEEPITHLQWFMGLLDEAGLKARDQALVMTLPGSYLDVIARDRGISRRPLQPDGGNGTPGRFSAPGTRVFLLPAALDLLQAGAAPGALLSTLSRAWELYDLSLATSQPERHQSTLLAARLSDAATDGACLLLLRLAREWESLFSWNEQLMEESLGKGGKGVALFPDQPAVDQDGPIGRAGAVRSLIAIPGTGMSVPMTRSGFFPGLVEADLSRLAATFLQWELTTALYGYLEDIVFAGQPAVENYKSRARELRQHDDPLQVALDTGSALPYPGATLVLPAGSPPSEPATDAFARLLREAVPLTYLDLTVNGELPEPDRAAVESDLHRLGKDLLGVPVKLRRAPAAYHSTEQMQMDGIPGVVSLRAVSTEHDPVLLGEYDDRFLKAQAVATWQAMNEAGRPCALLIVEGPGENLGPVLSSFLRDVSRRMDEGEETRQRD